MLSDTTREISLSAAVSYSQFAKQAVAPQVLFVLLEFLTLQVYHVVEIVPCFSGEGPHKQGASFTHNGDRRVYNHFAQNVLVFEG